jgi:hypothetical protein
VCQDWGGPNRLCLGISFSEMVVLRLRIEERGESSVEDVRILFLVRFGVWI